MAEPRWRRMVADERREEIFTCARRLFMQRPYSEVSTVDIAREANVARGLLNHYFGTKRNLYLEVVREAASVPLLAPETVPDGSMEERIGRAVEWYLDALESQGAAWISIGVGREPDLDKILVEAENETVDRLLQVLDLGGEVENRRQLRAFIRSFGQMARAAGREWLSHGTLTRDQVQVLLTRTLVGIVTDVIPQALPAPANSSSG